jgi:hypothetical protein
MNNIEIFFFICDWSEIWEMKQTISYLEVRRACREDDPVGPNELTLGTQGDVHQGLFLQETVEHGEEGGPVVIPLQTELLIICRHRLANLVVVVVQSCSCSSIL